jgi:hydroxymethylpyrimidine pyrophosphatase-like HAD family hydrolase
LRPVSELTASEARGLRGLLFDLDDTLLSHGVLTRLAYDALWSLADAGLRLVAVTGRPSGWGEVIARQWPIDGAVTENGAIAVWCGPRSGEAGDVPSARERGGSGITLSQRCTEAERHVRRMRLADDVDARRADVTWDIGERVKMPEDRIAAILRVVAAAGARSFVSSVHLHATFDEDDKASGTLRYLASAFGEDAGAATAAAYAFVGDSGNDAACFGAFRITFGVANVRKHLARIPVTPKYVANAEMGEGFAEVAQAIVRGRRSAG